MGVSATVFGMTAAERLRRQLARLPKRDGILWVAPEVVVDTPALGFLMTGAPLRVVDRERRVLLSWNDGPDCPEQVAGEFDFASSGLKKRETFLAFALDRTPVRDAENALYFASYKGVTDIVTKYAWPRPALVVMRACIALGITPNFVTAISILLSLAALPLFWNGHLAAGLACAWGMTFLDTVDGKLARTTVTYSNFGNYFDHIPDLLFPPLWWCALIVGVRDLDTMIDDATLTTAFWVVIATYIAGRLCEGYFDLKNGFGPFIWRPRDAFFRLILARRNPNLVIMTAGVLIGHAALGYMAMAAWCAICAVLQVFNLIEAEVARPRGGKLKSFLETAP